jgi:hypothetical protein
MSIDIVGYVKDISTKDGVAKSGKPYTVYNVVVTGKDGADTRVGWGFNPPAFKEGVWIKTQAEQNGNFLNYKGAPVDSAAGPAPAATQSGSAPATPTGSGAVDRNASIIYQNSRTAAISLVATLQAADALPISQAKSKAAEATRYEQILDIVNKLTVQFYFDVDTLRLTESVADAGDVELTARGELPPEETAEEQEDDFGDEIPF